MDDLTQFAHRRIERGSKSFATAARFFDTETRSSVYLLYSWCRHCDDEVDNQELGFAAEAANTSISDRVCALEARTRGALDGSPDGPAFAALARVVAAHRIPHLLPLEHLEGFAMDAAGTRYHTVDDTLKYSWHVAGAVGVMMAMIMGARHPDALYRASDLGIAFQLTNIARDVMDDAADGRVYLPADWLAEEGVAPEAVADPKHRTAVHRVTVRLLDLADEYYASAAHGLPYLPPRASLAVGAARSVYRSIGRLVRGRGPAAWDERAVVGPAGKARAIASGVARTLWSRAAMRPPPPRTGLYMPGALDGL